MAQHPTRPVAVGLTALATLLAAPLGVASGASPQTVPPDAAVIEIAPPDPFLLPPDDIPDGLHLERLTLPDVSPPATPGSLIDEGDGAQTLYRDALGNELVVARTESSDTGGSFPTPQGAELIELADGREAYFGEIGELTALTWDIPEAGDECDCQQTGVVAARGVSRAGVLAVADGADVRAPYPLVNAGSLPQGLELVSTAPLLDPVEDLRGLSEQLEFSTGGGGGGGGTALVWVFGGDDALVEHLSFWIEDGVHRGSLYGAEAFVEQVEGNVVLAISVDLEAADMASLVANFLPGDANDAEEAIAEVHGEPVTAHDSCLSGETVEERTAVFGGVTDDGARWFLGLGVTDDGDVAHCFEVTEVGEQDSGIAGTGGSFDEGADPSMIEIGGATIGTADGRSWRAVTGAVTADAAEVFISVADDEPIEAQIADTGPAGGWRWFAIVVPVNFEGNVAVIALAFDRDGDEIAHGATE